jgi:uncharacterized membrane protein
MLERLRETKFTAQEFSYWAEIIHTPIRKLAHMTEYALLSWSFLLPAFFQNRAVQEEEIQSPDKNGKKARTKKALWKLCLRSILFSMLYASTDEFHQLFVEGRGASVRDVMIDTLGAALGMLLFIFLRKIFLTLSKKSAAF